MGKSFRHPVRIICGIMTALLLLEGLMAGPVLASTKIYYFNPGSFISHEVWAYDYYKKNGSQTVKADLNGDGKKEKLKISFNYKKNTCRLYVNGKFQFQYSYKIKNERLVSGSNLISGKTAKFGRHISNGKTEVYLIDLNKKDRYHEILVGSYDGISVYRYNGKKLKKYASASTPKYFTNVMDPNAFFHSGHHVRGDGKLEIRTEVHSFNNTIELWLIYKIKNGRFVLDTGATHYSVWDSRKVKKQKSGPEALYTVPESGKMPATSDLYAYNTSNYKSGNLKSLFTIPEGKKYEILKVKFGSKYTAMYVSYGKRKGWIFVRSENLLL